MPRPVAGRQVTLFQRWRCDCERERTTNLATIRRLTIRRSGVPKLWTDFTPSIQHLT